MRLLDILGHGPPTYDRPPYRPRACPCCGGGLEWDVVVFCRRCEQHREWCVALKPLLFIREEVPAQYPRLHLVK